MTEDPPRKPFELSVEAKLMISYLVDTKVGQSVTYGFLANLIGRSVDEVDGSYAPLITARRHLQNEHDIVFTTLPGIGIQRLSDPEIVDETAGAFTRMRRAAKRTGERLSKADFGSLSIAYQMRYSAAASVASVISYMTKPAQMMKIERRMPKGQPQLPISETLAMFKKTPPKE